jgi:AraC-like DNA-binding protein
MKEKANYTVSASVILQVIQYLSFRGADISKFLQEIGMEASVLDSPDERINVEQYIRVEEKAAELLQDPCLGLHMGQYTQAGNWTILGYMMVNCQNVLESFRKFTRYSDVIGNLIGCEIILNQDSVILKLSEPIDAPKISEHCYEGYFSSLMKLAREITGTLISPKEVGLMSFKKEYLDEYIQIFGDKAVFRNKDNYMLFERNSVELPAMLPNQKLLDCFESYAKEFLKEIEDRESYTYQTKKLLLSLMDSTNLNIKVIASELNISDRTLQANLKKEGSKFSNLLCDTRIQLAKKYLKEDYSIENITYLLGFSDASVFRKAFKKWLGMTPGEYRQSILT